MTAKSAGPRGVYAAPLTPMQDDLTVDLEKYVAHCRTLLAAGCQGLMPLGSTGEAHSFTVAERIAMMDALAESGLPTDRMLIGTSALAHPDAIRLARHAVSMGAAGVCIQPPFYYKPAETVGLLDFFARVIEGVADDALRVYVYDWGPNLHVHHSIEFFEKLVDAFPKTAVGIKDSSGDAAMLKERCRAFPDRKVFSGADGLALTCLRAGGAGAISGIANIVPEVMTRLFADYETDVGNSMQARIDEIRAAMSALPWFSALKATMAWLSNDPAWRIARPAIRQFIPAEEKTLFHSLAELGLDPARMAAA